MVLVHGHNDLPITTRSQPIPVPGRYGHTPFGVQSDFCCAPKHCGEDSPGIALLARYPGTLPISSHIFPLFNTIGAAPGSVNTPLQLVVVVQALRGDIVAQIGRIVARSALIKSISYVSFLEEI